MTRPALTRWARAQQDYRQAIRPIFARKCFDCHTNETRYPWYYPLPLARQLIDHDIREAKEHVDMSQDFPFAGHHDPEEQLEQLRQVIEEKSMPPLRYRLLHWDAWLSAAERQQILDWIRKSQAGTQRVPGVP